jgi:hypothetical protein
MLTNLAGLPSNTPVTFDYFNAYWGDNKTLANELWENINLDAQAIALSPEYISKHNLPESGPFPWDTEKRLYFPKVFHSLHCLVSLVKMLNSDNVLSSLLEEYAEGILRL